ncbi:TetR/AcrR family transcriptional regulator [Ningiella sp. W23]|uniref:TetR/AcrR family transcriptional regulator n=1 Tax=Ningiella sp. W23 TaxID=3023715 RepID=UPI0037579B11
MKTAEKVLMISLELFNQEGEGNVSSVDIANELDISPGNLYYHYRGKDEIIEALVERYVSRMSAIEQSFSEDVDFYRYLHHCLEIMHLFRFLFQNIAELCVRYPAINKKLQRVAKFQRKYLREFLIKQQKVEVLSGSSEDIDLLLDVISLVLFQSLNYYRMQGEVLNNPDIVYRELMTIFFSLQPYYKNRARASNIKQAILNKTIV